MIPYDSLWFLVVLTLVIHMIPYDSLYYDSSLFLVVFVPYDPYDSL